MSDRDERRERRARAAATSGAIAKAATTSTDTARAATTAGRGRGRGGKPATANSPPSTHVKVPAAVLAKGIKTLKVVKFSAVYESLPLPLVAPAIHRVVGNRATILRMRGAALDDSGEKYLEMEFLTYQAAAMIMSHYNKMKAAHRLHLQLEWSDRNLDDIETPTVPNVSYREPKPDSQTKERLPAIAGFNRYLPWQ